MAREWTDDRLDALSEKVDLGFRHVDKRFEQVDRRFEQVDRRFEQVDKRFDKVDADVRALRTEMKTELGATRERIDSVQRAIVFQAVTMTGAILAGFAGMCTLIAATL